MKKLYFVYIMSNRSRMLYTGVTNDLPRRVYEHRHKLFEGYTRRYNVTQLVYFETTDAIWEALAREKQIKGWSRKKKVALICSKNPDWNDLAVRWF